MKVNVAESIIKYEDGTLEYLFKEIKVEEKFVQTYFNTTSLLRKVSTCARDLIYFLAEEMDINNQIATTHLTINKFNERLEYFEKGSSYKEQTVIDAIRELKKIGLLIQGVKRGAGWVNPKHLFRGTEANRYKLIIKIQKILVDHKYKQDGIDRS